MESATQSRSSAAITVVCAGSHASHRVIYGPSCPSSSYITIIRKLSLGSDYLLYRPSLVRYWCTASTIPTTPLCHHSYYTHQHHTAINISTLLPYSPYCNTAPQSVKYTSINQLYTIPHHNQSDTPYSTTINRIHRTAPQSINYTIPHHNQSDTPYRTTINRIHHTAPQSIKYTITYTTTNPHHHHAFSNLHHHTFSNPLAPHYHQSTPSPHFQ